MKPKSPQSIQLYNIMLRLGYPVEFADIVMGVFGFIVMFLVFSVVRGIYKLIRNLIRGDRKDE